MARRLRMTTFSGATDPEFIWHGFPETVLIIEFRSPTSTRSPKQATPETSAAMQQFSCFSFLTLSKTISTFGRWNAVARGTDRMTGFVADVDVNIGIGSTLIEFFSDGIGSSVLTGGMEEEDPSDWMMVSFKMSSTVFGLAPVDSRGRGVAEGAAATGNGMLTGATVRPGAGADRWKMTGLGDPASETSAERSSSELLGRNASSGFVSR